jgi:chromate transporter
VESVFKGLRPAVIGLLAAAALLLMNEENFGNAVTDRYQFIISCLLFLFAFVSTSRFKANPILMIIICGLIGLVVY